MPEKWGKIGAPRSAKRSAWLAKIRTAKKGRVLKRSPAKSPLRVTRRSRSKYKTMTMPRRRKVVYRRVKVPRSRKRRLLGTLQKPVVSGVIYAFVQPFVSQFLSRFNIGIQDELVQIAAAVILKNVTRSSLVNSYANAAIIVNTASLVAGFAGKILPTGGATTQPTSVYVVG